MPGRKSVRIGIRLPDHQHRRRRLAWESAWRSFLSLRDPAALPMVVREKLDHLQPTEAPDSTHPASTSERTQ